MSIKGILFVGFGDKCEKHTEFRSPQTWGGRDMCNRSVHEGSLYENAKMLGYTLLALISMFLIFSSLLLTRLELGVSPMQGKHLRKIHPGC